LPGTKFFLPLVDDEDLEEGLSGIAEIGKVESN